MKALFIGGTGTISVACTRLAAQRGWRLTLLNRGNRAVPLPEGVEVLRADIHNPGQTAAALAGRTFDVVANFINFTAADIERDIRLFQGRTGQYVFISSASVYEKPPRHYLITESTPTVNPFWEYSRNKIAAEQRLLAEHGSNGFPFTIVRPSLTYDDAIIPLPTNSWSKPWTIVNRMRAGRKVIIHGDGSSLWTCTHNTDVARGFVGLLGNPQAIGQAVHITSDEVLTWQQHYEIVAEAAGSPLQFVHIPSDWLIAANPNLCGSLLGDKSRSIVFDNSKIKRLVPDYVAATTFRQGMQANIARMLADASLQQIDHDQDRWCDRVIAGYEQALAGVAAT